MLNFPHFRTYDYFDSTQQVVYQPNNDPRETGSGSSAVYSFYGMPPERPSVGTLEVHLTSDEAVGATVAKLKTIVKPRMYATSEPKPEGTPED